MPKKMNIKSKISEVNSILLCDYNSHKNNQTWIANNIPASKLGNKFDYLRQDAPFYCSSSLEVMLKYYQSKNDFIDFIDETVSNLSSGDLSNANISELIDWIIYQTSDCINEENSDKTDIQNVGWWMGRSVYVTSIVSINYKAQYEKLFIEAWCKYFTNENLGSRSFNQSKMDKDHLSLLEEYLDQLNVPSEKKILSNGEVFYSFEDFSAGFVYIKVLFENNIPVGLTIKGLHKEMNELAHFASITNSLLNIPILHYVIMDGDKMTPQIIAEI